MEPALDTQPLPPLKYTYKSKGGVFSINGPPAFEKDDFNSDSTASTYEYSKDGTLIAILNQQNIKIHKTLTGVLVNTINRPNVLHIHVSNNNTYLLTFERYNKDGDHNLCVWNILSGEMVISFYQKVFTRENWPTIKWSDDETVVGHMVQNEIHFFNPSLTQTIQTLRVPNVSSFSISPGKAPYKIATFVPEKNSSPSSVQLVEYPKLNEVITAKTFFRGTSADFIWNSTGSSVLVITHTDIDKTGKSYYGEDGIFYLSADGSLKNVPLSKEGPIHECVWSPDGTQFIVIYGFMPAKATLYGLDGIARADFGSAPRNTARFSPNGHIVVISGFGILLGEMDFWDTKRIKLIGKAQAHCSAICEWSPDSNYVLTAVLSPRIRVDNGYKIFNYEGQLIHEEKVNELYNVSWRPAPGVYPNKKPIFTRKDLTSTPSNTTTSTTTTAKYRHPNFSGNSVSIRKEEDRPIKFKPKTEPQKKETPQTFDQTNRKRGKKKPVVQEQPSAAFALLSAEAEDPQKKIKELTKQLRIIAQLKEQQANGKVLTENQLAKIASEQSVKNQLNNTNKF